MQAKCAFTPAPEGIQGKPAFQNSLYFSGGAKSVNVEIFVPHFFCRKQEEMQAKCLFSPAPEGIQGKPAFQNSSYF